MSGLAASIPVGEVVSGSGAGNGGGWGEDAGGGAAGGEGGSEGEGDGEGEGEGGGEGDSEGEGEVAGEAAVEPVPELPGLEESGRAASPIPSTAELPGASAISATDSPSDSTLDPAFDSAFDSRPGSEGLSDEIEEFTPSFSILRGGPATFAATIPIIISTATIPRAMMITSPAPLIALIIIFKIPGKCFFSEVSCPVGKDDIYFVSRGELDQEHAAIEIERW